ncbi:MAG: serine/threonine protein phosphatase [Candidatus Bipolaricaulota bacterium]|nr:serine/threonine protein phosphatase [Candidatus Bipolaricaulota bacterium]MDW8151787.1 metallophosphoesterase family protein [Candidatus Bipolaricaulota bacterium]
MLDLALVAEFREVLAREPRLIRLPLERTAVFVGDTHGDREASEEVLRRYFDAAHVLVFLGDYVDRGPDSPGNLALLMRAKVAHPERIFLLMGNHEAWAVAPFVPADFWRALSPREEKLLAETLALLPFAAFHPAGVLAVHGALPDVDELEEIEHVPLGSANWRKMTWGDWVDGPGYQVDPGVWGRPAYGRDYFFEVMERLGLRVLVRAHQPDAPLFLFGGRCLTLFTSHAYGPGPRRVALLPPAARVRSGTDLAIQEL